MKEIVTERAIGTWLKTWCTNKGFRCIKLNPATYIGMPDRLVLTTNGQVVFIELKTFGAALRPMQVNWKGWLTKNGFNYILLDKIDDSVVTFIESYFESLNGDKRFC